MTASNVPPSPAVASSASTYLAPPSWWGRKYHGPTLLVLGLGLAATGLLWRNSVHHARHEMQSNFDFSVREASTRIEQRMAAYEQVLQSTMSFMSHADLTTRGEFRHFVEKLRLNEKYPGIQALSFELIVPAAQIEPHLAAIRAEGFPDYAIFPSGARTLYAPVIYIEPFSGANLRAFGHDPYVDTVRRTAMERARDLDLPVITGKVTLAQETGKNVQAGFVMYLPVFQFGAAHASVAERGSAILGWVSAPFRMNDLMDGVQGEQAAILNIELFDGEQVAPRALMYDPDHDYVGGKPGAGLFKTTRRIAIANHAWTMQVRSLPEFDARLDRTSPRIIAVCGIGISLLLSLLTLVLAGGRQRALTAARKMNEELIESEARYRQMFQNNASIAYLVDPDSGRIVDANAAAAAFTGYSLEQLLAMNIADINVASHQHIAAAMHQVGEGQRIRMEWHHRLKNGEIRDVEVFTGPLTYRGAVLLYSIVHDISARKQAEQALLESEARSREITATIGEGVFVTDQSGAITFCNPEAKRLLGWSNSVLIGQNAHALVHHSHIDGTPYPAPECKIRAVLDSGLPFRSHDEAFWRKDGSMLPVSVNATPIIRGRQVMGTVVAFHDIIGRKQAQQALAGESAKNAMLLRTASDGIHVLDMEGKVVMVNDAFCRMLGYTQEALHGMDVTQWDAQWSAQELKEKLSSIMDQDTLFETRYRRSDGSLIEVEMHTCGVEIDGKRLLYAAARDITERKKAVQQLLHLAHFDMLTDLPNRSLLNDRLQQALVKARRNDTRLALMFLDLDRFKPVNDRFGHGVGDLLLKEVALRAKDCVRESDTVARLGGDEFVVLLPDIEDEAGARLVAQKILAALALPYQLAGHELHITASIGIAVFPEHGADEHMLMKRADLAMYRAKHAGGSALMAYGDLAEL